MQVLPLLLSCALCASDLHGSPPRLELRPPLDLRQAVQLELAEPSAPEHGESSPSPPPAETENRMGGKSPSPPHAERAGVRGPRRGRLAGAAALAAADLALLTLVGRAGDLSDRHLAEHAAGALAGASALGLAAWWLVPGEGHVAVGLKYLLFVPAAALAGAVAGVATADALAGRGVHRLGEVVGGMTLGVVTAALPLLPFTGRERDGAARTPPNWLVATSFLTFPALTAAAASAHDEPALAFVPAILVAGVF